MITPETYKNENVSGKKENKTNKSVVSLAGAGRSYTRMSAIYLHSGAGNR